MKHITPKSRPKPKCKKPVPDSKKPEKPLNSDKVFVNLIADVVFENLLNKYRKWMP